MVVAVDVDIVEDVIGPYRLDLGNGVVERPRIPEPHVVERGPILYRVDGRVRLHLEIGCAHVLLQAEGSACGMNVRLDVRPFERDLVR